MANDPGLAQLRDIHLPAEIGLWPLAPGWYILFSVLFVIIIVMTRVWIHRRARNAPKRKALALLAQYEQQYKQEGNREVTCQQLSALLRRVALAYYPRIEIASLQGQEWVNFLTSTSKNLDFSSTDTALLVLPYHHAVSDIDLAPLFSLTSQWIKQRGSHV